MEGVALGVLFARSFYGAAGAGWRADRAEDSDGGGWGCGLFGLGFSGSGTGLGNMHGSGLGGGEDRPHGNGQTIPRLAFDVGGLADPAPPWPTAHQHALLGDWAQVPEALHGDEPEVRAVALDLAAVLCLRTILAVFRG